MANDQHEETLVISNKRWSPDWPKEVDGSSFDHHKETKIDTSDAFPVMKTVTSKDDYPLNDRDLWKWVTGFMGVRIATCKVCEHHQSTWSFFRDLFFLRPPVALVLGPRGGGKSYLSALNTHLESRWHPRHETKVLGGSLAQSEQIYRALCDFAGKDIGSIRDDFDAFGRMLNARAIYKNGSEVSILAASNTSVRGPHVPSLKLDEIDEIDPEIREAAMGMCMSRLGSSASVVMSSTWHRIDGPMATLIDQSSDGQFPLYRFCIFEVLERCPEERSGSRLEKCPACPLFRYCHDVSDKGPPKAKRSNGHYTIDSLIQKIQSTSRRTFEADYLCLGPKPDGLWFPGFSTGTHVSECAEFDWNLPVHVAIDSGVFTGAVFFQVAYIQSYDGPVDEIHIFADHLTEGMTAEQNARSILEVARKRCNARYDILSTDPAGNARNAVGPTVIAEYERAGLKPIRHWPIGSVADGLALVESFVTPADGRSRFFVHPRCQATINAMQSYRRAKRGGQWQDYPEDPQHPQEELVDSIRGGLRICFPDGRSTKKSILTRVPARQVF